VEIKSWDVNVIQKLAVVLDRVAGGHEHDDLLLDVLLQERVQEGKPALALAHNVSL
jgi:hypothetical protein